MVAEAGLPDLPAAAPGGVTPGAPAGDLLAVEPAVPLTGAPALGPDVVLLGGVVVGGVVARGAAGDVLVGVPEAGVEGGRGGALRQAYLVRERPKERLVWCWSGRLTLRSAWAYLEPRRRWVEEWNLRSS